MIDAVKMYIIYALLGCLVAAGIGWTVHALYLRAQIVTKDAKINSLSEDNFKLTNSLTIALDTNTKLETSVREQNAGIAQWVKEAEDRRVSGEQAIAKAKKDGEAWRTKYQKLLGAPPANPEDQCGSLDLRLTEYIESRSQP